MSNVFPSLHLSLLDMSLLSFCNVEPIYVQIISAALSGLWDSMSFHTAQISSALKDTTEKYTVFVFFRSSNSKCVYGVTENI